LVVLYETCHDARSLEHTLQQHVSTQNAHHQAKYFGKNIFKRLFNCHPKLRSRFFQSRLFHFYICCFCDKLKFVVTLNTINLMDRPYIAAVTRSTQNILLFMRIALSQHTAVRKVAQFPRRHFTALTHSEHIYRAHNSYHSSRRVVCCQVEVSAIGRSLVQRNLRSAVVSMAVWQPDGGGALGSLGLLRHKKSFQTI
jgi:hypothetical protein